VKRRLLIKAIEEAGYNWKRRDGAHDIFVRKGSITLQVPKHKEINNNVARAILDIAGMKERLKK
jgi:mRNA interferase HicA